MHAYNEDVAVDSAAAAQRAVQSEPMSFSGRHVDDHDVSYRHAKPRHGAVVVVSSRAPVSGQRRAAARQRGDDGGRRTSEPAAPTDVRLREQ